VGFYIWLPITFVNTSVPKIYFNTMQPGTVLRWGMGNWPHPQISALPQNVTYPAPLRAFSALTGLLPPNLSLAPTCDIPRPTRRIWRLNSLALDAHHSALSVDRFGGGGISPNISSSIALALYAAIRFRTFGVQ